MNKLELKKLIKEEANKILVPRRSGEEREKAAKRMGIENEDDRTAPQYTNLEMMESIANIQDLRNSRSLINSLANEWFHDGFEHDDVIEFFTEYINTIPNE